MRLIYSAIILAILFAGCQPKQDNSAKETFEKNSKTVAAYLKAFEDENVDYAAYYADDAIMLGTAFGDQDSIDLATLKANEQASWEMFDFKLLDDPVNFLPGVDSETKMMDGSVRYYGEWEVTLSATDSTPAKSGVIKIYESYDFDDNGKILFQQGYGDFGGLMNYLHSAE